MKSIIYSGSFDPITLGHLNIIERLSSSFENIIVAVSESKNKNYLFSAQERKDLVEKSLGDMKNIKVEICKDLITDFALQKSCTLLARGLRNTKDLQREVSMNAYNRGLNSNIETVFILTLPEYSHISSSGVKEVALYSKKLGQLVPSEVIEPLRNKMSRI